MAEILESENRDLVLEADPCTRALSYSKSLGAGDFLGRTEEIVGDTDAPMQMEETEKPRASWFRVGKFFNYSIE